MCAVAQTAGGTPGADAADHLSADGPASFRPLMERSDLWARVGGHSHAVDLAERDRRSNHSLHYVGWRFPRESILGGRGFNPAARALTHPPQRVPPLSPRRPGEGRGEWELSVAAGLRSRASAGSVNFPRRLGRRTATKQETRTRRGERPALPAGRRDFRYCAFPG